MLWRDPQARGYFLGQFPDDHLDEAWTSADEPSGQADEPRFDTVLEEAELHLDRLKATGDTEVVNAHVADVHQQEQSPATATIESDDAATVPARRVRRASRRRATGRRRTRLRRSRIAAVVTIVAVLLAGTGLYVRTQADAADKRVRRPTSTSLDQRSMSTTDTPTSFNAAPETEPTPASAPPPVSQSGAPLGTTPSPSRGTAPRGPAPAPAPVSTGSPPSNSSPPGTPPPGNPACQLLPVVCP